MNFLSSLFSNKDRNLQPAATPIIAEQPEIRETDFVDHSEPNSYVITYGTQMPIDAIYHYIDQDFEPQGYDDAMCSNDASYKEKKMNYIRNGLIRLFDQVALRYRSDLRDLEVEIKMLAEQGLMNMADRVEARKNTFIEHLNTIAEMQQALNADDPKMLSMISSYERGFLKGLTAKATTLLQS